MSWQGLFVPAKTPSTIVRKIHTDVVAVLNGPAVKERLRSIGYVAVGSTPDELGAMLKTEIGKWSAVIKGAGLKVD